jgi:hypothetical protein
MSFAKIFSRAALSEQFDGKVIRTLSQSKQFHADIVEQLQAACPSVDFPTLPDGAMQHKTLHDLFNKIENGKPFTKTITRTIHAVLCEASKTLGTKAPALPDWAAKAEVKSRAKPETTTPTLDALDVIGNIGKITDADILNEIIKIANAQLAKQVPAMV